MTATAGNVQRQQEAPREQGYPHRWRILAVLASVAFMAQLDLFIVNIAAPAIGRSFGGASLSGLSWVLNAYAIVFAALLVPADRLADHFGRRRLADHFGRRPAGGVRLALDLPDQRPHRRGHADRGLAPAA